MREDNWTDTEVARLRGFFALGYSFRDIGKEIGRSRSACIGKAHRIKLYRDPTAARSNASKAQRRRRGTVGPSKTRKPGSAHVERLPANQAVIEAADIEDHMIPDQQRKTLFDLTEDTCRWPVGDPTSSEFFFCGDTPERGHPYCAGHLKRAWQQSAPRQRVGERTAPDRVIGSAGFREWAA